MGNYISGRQFELDVFGFCSTDEGIQSLLKYRSFMSCMNKSISKIKKNGWDTGKSIHPPDHLLVSRLLYEIRELANNEDTPFTVKVYPTVGTILDYLHGVDGLITARSLDKKRKALVPFDITINPYKTPKQEIVVLRPQNFTDEEMLKQTATFFVEIIQRQLSLQEH